MKRIQVSGKVRTLEAPAAPVEIHWIARPGGWWVGEWKNSAGVSERIRAFGLLQRAKLTALLGGRAFHLDVLPDRESSSGGGGTGAGTLVASFPGKVRKILVQDGAQVRADEPLLKVEAMKMEFSITAPSDGLVKKVCFKEGDSFLPGQNFVEFEAAPKKGPK